jgi:lysophospholipase L1-like esterase
MILVMPPLVRSLEPETLLHLKNIQQELQLWCGNQGMIALDFPLEVIPLLETEALSIDRMKRILGQSVDHPRILMLGDSLTEHGADWNQRLGRSDILNAGQGGYTTGQIAWLLDPCLDRNSIEKAFFSAGINDLSLGIDPHVVYANVVSIANRLRDRGVELVIQSTILQEDDAAVNRIIRDLNRKLEAFCENRHLAFLDLNANLAGDSGLKAEFTTDGTHLTESGYAVWADTLLQSGLLDTPVPLDKLTLPDNAGNQ